jgi:transcriptional regulator with XRE-family HTH domain
MPRRREKPPRTPELGALGLAVETVRLKRGDTQESVGAKKHADHKLAGPIERGQSNPSYLTLVRLADALDSSLEEIVALAERNFREGKVERVG